jgi:hypothetical protein
MPSLVEGKCSVGLYLEDEGSYPTLAIGTFLTAISSLRMVVGYGD